MEEYQKPEIRSEKIEIGVYGQYLDGAPGNGKKLGWGQPNNPHSK